MSVRQSLLFLTPRLAVFIPNTVRLEAVSKQLPADCYVLVRPDLHPAIKAETEPQLRQDPVYYYVRYVALLLRQHHTMYLGTLTDVVALLRKIFIPQGYLVWNHLNSFLFKFEIYSNVITASRHLMIPSITILERGPHDRTSPWRNIYVG